MDSTGLVVAKRSLEEILGDVAEDFDAFYVQPSRLRHGSKQRPFVDSSELKIRKGLRNQFLKLIRGWAQLVKPSRPLLGKKDPDDNKFFECADAARADYLVTGNQKHFPKFWKKTIVISSREFIDLVAPHLLP